jgi:hypothetical protein
MSSTLLARGLVLDLSVLKLLQVGRPCTLMIGVAWTALYVVVSTCLAVKGMIITCFLVSVTEYGFSSSGLGIRC